MARYTHENDSAPGSPRYYSSASERYSAQNDASSQDEGMGSGQSAAGNQAGGNRDEEVRRAADRASALMRSYASAQERMGAKTPEDQNPPAGRARHASRRHAKHAEEAQKRVQEPAKNHSKPLSQMTLADFISHNAVYIVGVAAVVAIVAIMLVVARSCVPTQVYDYDGELSFEYESPFESDDFFMTAKGRYEYEEEGKGTTSRTGIDVSENQDVIDWEAVAADGIDFAMIRLGYRGATEGDLYVDARFAENLKAAQAAGVDCGVYFFSQAVDEKEAREEADFIVKNLGGAMLEYPVALDYEEAVPGVVQPRGAGLGKDKMSSIADAFCKRIEEAGYHSMVYGNYYDLDLFHYDFLTTKEVWWAEYDVAEPSPNMDITMWQYASEGWVDGISTPVDMNLDLSQALT